MNKLVRQVHLHGAHAEIFALAVDSAAEAVRAITTLRPGLRQVIREGNWCVVIGDLDNGYDLDATQIHAKAGSQPIHIIPEVMIAGGFFRGGVGKILIGAVLIAAAVFLPGALQLGGAFAAIGAAGGTGWVTSAVLGMGISMVLGGTAMLISPMPKGPKSTELANPEERASFFFNGPVNISEQGAPIPLVYGYFRVGSIVVNVGLWNEDIAAEEVEGSTVLASMRALSSPEILTGADPASRLYPNQEIMRPLLSKGGGKGGSAGSAYAPREVPNNLRSRSLVRIHEVLCEGGIKGPRTWPHWGKSVFFDNTPLQDSAGNFNFQLTFTWFRGGWPNEGPIPGFPASENVINVSAEVKYEEPVVRRVTSLETTFIRLQLRVPRLLRQMANGDVVGTYTEMAIDYQVEGQPWAQLIYNKLEGKTTTGYERTYTFWLPPRDGREIDLRVRRISIDPDMHNPGDETPPYKEYSETFWSTFTEVVDGVMLHNTEASFAMTVDAEQFPSIPKRSYEMDWLIVLVPSNYNPYTRVYTGDWNGTFKWDWTNNPAWVLYDMMTHPKRGLGRDLSGNVVDVWSFYYAAQYNDQLVANGLGGTEPRFTFNGILNTQEEAMNVLQSVASSFRAQFYVAGGIVYLTQDRPEAITRLFTPANVELGTFDYQSTEIKSRVTVANVSWIDPSQDWLPQVEPVMYTEMMGRFGYRELSLNAYGCTSKGQAIRAGRYFLFGAHHEQELVSFVVGLEHCDLRPGDVFGIQDPGRAAIDWSGRVLKIEDNYVTLDRNVGGLINGIVWFSTLNTTTFETTVFSREFSTVTGVPNMIHVNDPAGIVPDTVWALTTSIQMTSWRVVSVAEQEDFKFQITATFYDNRKQAFVEQNILPPETDYSVLPSGALVPPTGLTAQDMYTLDPSGSPQAGIVWSWTPSADPRIVQYIGDAQGPGNRAPHHWSSIPGTTIGIPQADTGEWKFNVKGADALGRKSLPITIVYNTAASARVPMPPVNMSVVQTGITGAAISWNRPDDLSISFWWLKWTPETNPAYVRWDSAITIQASIPRDTLSIVLPSQTGTFLLKSISVRGRESNEHAYAIFNMTDLRPFGVYHVEQPTWPGTKSNFTVELEELVLDAPDVMVDGYPDPMWAMRHPRNIRPEEALAVGEYITPVLSLSQSAEVLSKVLLSGRGVVTADIMANWVPLAVAVPLTRTTSADWDTQVDERSSLDNVTWTAWRPASSGHVIAKHMQYRLLAASYTLGTDVKFSRMEEWLMFPAYDQNGTSTTSPTGFVTVELEPDYYQAPEIHIQPIGETTAILSLTSVHEDEFTVRSTTPAGAAAPSVPFSWIAYGHGRLP